MMCFLLIAGRRHYTVDILLAWYIVPLVWASLLFMWPDPTPAMLASYFDRMGCVLAASTEAPPDKVIDMVPDPFVAVAAVSAAEEHAEAV